MEQWNDGILGSHIYQCKDCGHVELIPHSCESRFCPTCGKPATDVWDYHVCHEGVVIPGTYKNLHG